MPTYEYQCAECGYVYDVFHKMSEKPLTKCPKCSKDALKRSIGGQNAVLNFKGKGFYITDYVKNSSENKSKDPQKD